MRMSRGASNLSEKPRPASSSCIDDTPMSKTTPSAASTPRRFADRVELAEARFREPKPAAGRSRQRRAGANGRRVAVDGDDRRAAIEERARIAAGAERGVDIDAAGAGLERGHRLLKQDGNVAELGRGGSAHRGVSPGASASRSARKRRTRARASSRWV